MASTDALTSAPLAAVHVDAAVALNAEAGWKLTFKEAADGLGVALEYFRRVVQMPLVQDALAAAGVVQIEGRKGRGGAAGFTRMDLPEYGALAVVGP